VLSDERLREFQRIVHRWYPVARESILFYETEESRKAIESITELRDVLDHFWLSGTLDDETEAQDYLRLIEDHLRSVAVEPLERAVEERLARVQEARKRIGGARRILWHILLLNVPPTRALDDSEEIIKDHIRQGRSKKGHPRTAEAAIEHFRLAHAHLLKLEPLFAEPDIRSRAFPIALTAISITISLLLGVFVSPWLRELAGSLFR
jgi:hypothetical protein